MIWNFDPVAFSLLGISIRWYGLVYVLGFFLALQLGWHLQKSLTPTKISKKNFENLTFGLFLWGVIGGRIGHFLFYNPSVFRTDIWEILKVWHGGMSIHGGLLGALIFAFLWYRKHGVRFLWITDIFTLPLAITLIFGRIANFLNGELVGRPTGTDWGVIFPHIDSTLRHPSQLYESGKNLLLVLLLLYFLRKGYGRKEGFCTAFFLFGYGVLRFGIEFVRAPDGVLWGLTHGQWLSLLMVGVAAFLAKKQYFWHNPTRGNNSPHKK